MPRSARMLVRFFLCLALVGGVVASTPANALAVDRAGYTYMLEPHPAH